MAAGNSPIVEAIRIAEQGTTGEIRVHLSKRWIEKDAYARAERIFHEYGMTRTTHRNAVLLYVNLRRHKFAIIGDESIHERVGSRYWQRIARRLSEDLRSTHPERAIAMAVQEIGEALKKHFPADLNEPNPDELGNDVSSD